MRTPDRTAITIALGFFLCAQAAPGVHAAVDPVDKCTSKKIQAAGKLLGDILKCHSKAAKKALALDPACVTKATGRADGQFAKAGDVCGGDAVTTRLQMLDAADAILLEILPSGHGAEGSKCESSKLKAAGKYGASVMKAHAKNVLKPDAAKLTGALDKALDKLEGAFSKAEAKGDCETTANEATVVGVADAATQLALSCLAAGGGCDASGADGGAGGITVTTDGEADGADAADPIETTVTSKGPGPVSIVEGPVTQPPVSGFDFLGVQVDIVAPDATAGDPLIIVFVIDSSIIPGPPLDVQIFRSGVQVADCSGAPGTASPDPCVDSRNVLGDGDLEMTVLTSSASPWVPGVSADCPTSMTWEAQADDGIANTASIHEIGRSGEGHHTFPLDQMTLSMGLACPGSSGACGTCTVTGALPNWGNCRCDNDPTVVCDEPLAADADDCGGALCECYSSAPEPLVGGGGSVCSVFRLASDLTGTWDPQAGAGDVAFDELWDLYLGLSLEQPCPVCVGDTAPNDGSPDGTCDGGGNDGGGCDANGSDASFPVDGGGQYSLDCLPAVGTLISGVGVPRPLVYGTGADALAAGVPCGFPPSVPDDCHCGKCDGDPTIGCAADADCVAAGAGTTCEADGTMFPSDCSDGICVAGGDGHGVCNTDTDTYCDARVRVDGSGILPCSSNGDCSSLGPGWGSCTLSQPRDCFHGGSITATGSADPATPVTAALTCLGNTPNAAVNGVLGLPGPARLTTERIVSFDNSGCASALTWSVAADDGIADTASIHQVGTSGLTHHTFPLDEMTVRMGLSCPGSPGSCGNCTVTGVQPGPGNCRCDNDNTTVCDEPFAADADDCGGALCECYTSAPEPIVGGGSPGCSLFTLASNLTGTWDPDAGAGAIAMDELWHLYIGESTEQPCPVCVGDTTANDGSPDGTCDGGANDGGDCDANGSDASFPVGGGGQYSLDCLPPIGALISGAGVPRYLLHTTGADALAAGVPCGFPPGAPADCHCGSCDGNPAVVCMADADCVAAGAGTTCDNEGEFANGCSDVVCVAGGDGYGVCNTDTVDYCDGFVRVDGTGILTCSTNSDCSLFGPTWGNCTINEPKECFDAVTITGSGTADPSDPVTMALGCLGRLGNPSANNVIGLPGPVRLFTQRSVQ